VCTLGRIWGWWHPERDLRSTKSTMQIIQLRGKIPVVVRKKVWMRDLVYNLIRTEVSVPRTPLL
jgi:hypothetical protein